MKFEIYRGECEYLGRLVDREFFRGGMALLLAGIDVGTLTCRLLIGEVAADASMKEIESDRQILRLGEGVDQSGRLKAAAMTRVVQTLCEWRERMQAYPLAGVAVVATSAVREASNRGEFLGHVKREAGFVRLRF